MLIDITDQQFHDIVIEWYSNPTKPFVISGYAGCGKTTRAKQIPTLLNIPLDNVAFLTPTGKASLVLHERAQTIHSFRYNSKEVINSKGERQLVFAPKDITEFHEKLLILDEISMVGNDILEDLIALNIPIIALGDPAQLPPVAATNDILERPNILLTKVYRQDGGLLDLATDIRKFGCITPLNQYNDVDIIFSSSLKDIANLPADYEIIVKFNKTRQLLNQMRREALYNFTQTLEVGEKLMCLNNTDVGLMNGSLMTLLEIVKFHTVVDRAGKDLIHRDIATVRVMDNITKQEHTMDFDISIILGKQYYGSRTYPSMDYAYAITCHKAQGSEYDNVAIFNEGRGIGEHGRWLYTAVTRARKKVKVFF